MNMLKAIKELLTGYYPFSLHLNKILLHNGEQDKTALGSPKKWETVFRVFTEILR